MTEVNRQEGKKDRKLLYVYEDWTQSYFPDGELLKKKKTDLTLTTHSKFRNLFLYYLKILISLQLLLAINIQRTFYKLHKSSTGQQLPTGAIILTGTFNFNPFKLFIPPHPTRTTMKPNIDGCPECVWSDHLSVLCWALRIGWVEPNSLSNLLTCRFCKMI